MTPGFPPRHSERREWDGETERPRWDRETDRGRRVRIRSRASPGRPDPPLGTGPPPGAGRGARPWGGGSVGQVSGPREAQGSLINALATLSLHKPPSGLAPQGPRSPGAFQSPAPGSIPGVPARGTGSMPPARCWPCPGGEGGRGPRDRGQLARAPREGPRQGHGPGRAGRAGDPGWGPRGGPGV